VRSRPHRASFPPSFGQPPIRSVNKNGAPFFYPAGAQRLELQLGRQAAPLFSFLACYPIHHPEPNREACLCDAHPGCPRGITRCSSFSREWSKRYLANGECLSPAATPTLERPMFKSERAIAGTWKHLFPTRADARGNCRRRQVL